jgi:hypothetical protein
MKLNAANIQQIQGYLRNVAEVDPNDTIANSASQLAVELEWVKTPFDYLSLSEAERMLVQYAISKRNVYVLHPGARHAVNTQPVTRTRRRCARVA